METSNNLGNNLSGIGSIIGGVAAPIGSLISGWMTNRAQEKSNRANMVLAKYQYEKNLEQWNRENEYNSPQEQMKRYKAAGLNPNLIYGQQNTSASSPQFDAPHIAPVTGMAQGLGNMFQQVTNAVSMMLGLERQKAEIAKLGAETSAIDYQNGLNAYFLDSEKAIRQRDYDFRDFMYQYQQSKYAAEWNYRKEELAKMLQVLPYQYEAQKVRYLTDKENYPILMGAKIGSLESSAALARTRNYLEMAKLPFAAEMAMTQLAGAKLLNTIRDKNTEQWRNFGFKGFGMNFTAGGLVELIKKIFGL